MKRFLSTVILTVAIAVPFAAADAAKYKEVTVKNGGVITGKISSGNVKPETKSYTISKNPEVCGTGTRDVPIVRVKDGALLDTVVYLVKVKSGKPFPAALKKLTLNQKGCEFLPPLSVMENGGVLEAVNSDETLHNIHTYELIKKARRTVLNVSQPEVGSVVEKKIKLRKGTAMKVECDAHDFMHAYVFVAKNPYYAVVNDKGEFEIKDVPPGKYKINAWHRSLGTKKGTVDVAANGKVTVNFSF